MISLYFPGGRDARKDPRPGDVLGIGRQRFKVLPGRHGWEGYVHYQRGARWDHAHWISLRGWRRLMRDPASLIVRAVGQA